MLSNGSTDVFSFLPLPGDPTIEEREEMTKEATILKTKANQDYERKVLEDYKKRGFQ